MATEPERRIEEALRARASGAGRAGPVARSAPDRGIRTALLIALLAGVVLGVILGLVSLLAPGVLPALG